MDDAPTGERLSEAGPPLGATMWVDPASGRVEVRSESGRAVWVEDVSVFDLRDRDEILDLAGRVRQVYRADDVFRRGAFTLPVVSLAELDAETRGRISGAVVEEARKAWILASRGVDIEYDLPLPADFHAIGSLIERREGVRALRVVDAPWTHAEIRIGGTRVTARLVERAELKNLVPTWTFRDTVLVVDTHVDWSSRARIQVVGRKRFEITVRPAGVRARHVSDERTLHFSWAAVDDNHVVYLGAESVVRSLLLPE